MTRADQRETGFAFAKQWNEVKWQPEWQPTDNFPRSNEGQGRISQGDGQQDDFFTTANARGSQRGTEGRR